MKHVWGVVIGTDELATYQERVWLCYTFESFWDAQRVASDMNAMHNMFSTKVGVSYFAVEWHSEEPPGKVYESGFAVND